MNFVGITVEELASAIGQCPTAELKALNLLRDRAPAPGSIYPASATREEITQAMTGLIAYMKECSALAQRVYELPGIALNSDVADGFSL